MRIIFAGTPDFAAHILTELLSANHEICAVYTQPDRPSGRGRKLTASPVKQIAQEHQIPIEQPLNFKSGDDVDKLNDYHADLMIVVAYGLLLPQEVLDTPRLGCINLHASLLPRWRGAAPIQRAILAGDQHTGVCVMQMEAGLDTGPVLSQAICEINPDDNAQMLHDRLAELGAATLIKALPNIETLQQQAKAQDEQQHSYANKLTKQEANIDWQQPAIKIAQQTNAFNPWPVAQTLWQDTTLRIWQAKAIECNKTTAEPGTIIAVDSQGIDIATEQGVLRLLQVQVPGKRAMAISDFLNANQPKIGEQLGQ